jgi:UDP-N-acetylglucosamine--N-acetylmuramyl-(pentapeptide) pyrophosphoryl-undecaprenol N-acetylglucosamine transferase
VSGNPVRPAFPEAIRKRKTYREKYGVPEGAFCVLFFGGSQGAEAVNKAAAETIERLGGYYFSILLTGRDYYAEYERRLGSRSRASLLLMDYSDSIYELYSAADLIVSRAGALTVSEITCCEKASVLIPSPNVTNNHQYYNARTLSDRGAAVLLPEEETGEGRLAAEIMKLAADPDTVRKMSRAAAKLAKPDAIKVIVDEIFRS